MKTCFQVPGPELKTKHFPKGSVTWELSLRGHVENFQGHSRQPTLLIVVNKGEKKFKSCLALNFVCPALVLPAELCDRGSADQI